MTAEQTKSTAVVGVLAWIVLSLAGQPILGGIAFFVAVAAALFAYSNRNSHSHAGLHEPSAVVGTAIPRMSAPALWCVSDATVRQTWKGDLERFPVLVGLVDVMELGVVARFQLPIGKRPTTFQPNVVKLNWDTIERVGVVWNLQYPPTSATVRPHTGQQDHGRYVGLTITAGGDGGIAIPLVRQAATTAELEAQGEQAIRDLLENDPIAAGWLAILREHHVRFWGFGRDH